MSSIDTQIGVFPTNNTTPIGPDFAKDIKDLFGATSIASIALTVLNFVVAVAAIILILIDNRTRHKTWKIAPSNRIPLGIATAISISHVFFIVKAFVGLASFHTFDPPEDKKFACRISNELGFWRIELQRPYLLICSYLDTPCHFGCTNYGYRFQHLFSGIYDFMLTV